MRHLREVLALALLSPALIYAQTLPQPTVRGMNLSGNLIYSGASSSTNSWMYQAGGTLSGTTSGAAVVAPFNFNISADTVDATTPGYLAGFNLLQSVNTGSKGGRIAIQAQIAEVGTPALVNSSGYVAGSFSNRVSANLGGATGAYANYVGGVFAINPNIFTTTGATFLSLVNGGEFDVTLASGSSAAEKHGLSIVQGANDAVRAVYDDSALEFNDQDSAGTTWLNGISFGGYAHLWPFGSDSTLITATARVVPSPATPAALNGVDFSAVNFGGCVFKSNGYCVNQAGGMKFGANISATSWTTAGIALVEQGATYTDSSGTGTIANEMVNAIASNAIAAQNAGVTITNLTNFYVNAPTAGANVTATNLWAIQTSGNELVGGKIQATGGANIFGAGTGISGGAISLNASSNFNTNLNTGTSTGTITIGNSGTFGATILAGVSTGTNADFLCLSGAGVVLLQTSACTISSARYKERIIDFTDALPIVGQLRAVSFNMKPQFNRDPNYGSRQVGLLAENVAQVAPQCAIFEDDMKTPKSYRQECVTALAIAAIQQQHRELENLKTIVAVLCVLLISAMILMRPRSFRAHAAHA